jgi:hypothetical protein
VGLTLYSAQDRSVLGTRRTEPVEMCGGWWEKEVPNEAKKDEENKTNFSDGRFHL